MQLKFERERRMFESQKYANKEVENVSLKT